VRLLLNEQRIAVVIPIRMDQAPLIAFDRAAYRERNVVVERLINRLTQHLRIATRYEKRAVNCRAIVTSAGILLWL